MKKTYIAPAVEITETMSQQMMAVSFAVSDKSTEDQLVNEDKAWNMWGED